MVDLVQFELAASGPLPATGIESGLTGALIWINLDPASASEDPSRERKSRPIAPAAH
jgi:hypothetical protein